MHHLKTPTKGVAPHTPLPALSVQTSPRSTPHTQTLEGLDSTWHTTLQCLPHLLHPSTSSPLWQTGTESGTESGTGTQEGGNGAGGIVSRRSSCQEANSSSKYSHPSHHSERGRGATNGIAWATETTADNVTTTHTTTAAAVGGEAAATIRTSATGRDRDSNCSNSSDPRFNSNSHHSSNSLSPPLSSSYPS